MEADGCRILASFDCYYRECYKAVNRECYKEPVIPVCFLRVKAIGVMPMIDQGEADDKIIAVCAHEREYKRYNDNKELPPHRLAQIRHFFADCIICLCRMQPE